MEGMVWAGFPRHSSASRHLIPLILVTGDWVSSREILFTKASGSHSWKEKPL